ncbi:MAG: hypothetical protein AAGD96_06115 [Chloroflexota bacterium]
MRFVLRTQPYEKPISAGSFRYEQDGKPNGIVESWSLAHALDGYKFFRVDVDARHLKTQGYSTLYNVVVGPDDNPENVKFRHFTVAPPAAENGLRLKGQIVFDEDAIFVSREFNGQRLEDEFEASVGLNLPVAAQIGAQQDHAKMLALNTHDYFRPVISNIHSQILETAENGYPIKVKVDSHITAVSTRLTIYR